MGFGEALRRSLKNCSNVIICSILLTDEHWHAHRDKSRWKAKSHSWLLNISQVSMQRCGLCATVCWVISMSKYDATIPPIVAPLLPVFGLKVGRVPSEIVPIEISITHSKSTSLHTLHRSILHCLGAVYFCSRWTDRQSTKLTARNKTIIVSPQNVFVQTGHTLVSHWPYCCYDMIGRIITALCHVVTGIFGESQRQRRAWCHHGSRSELHRWSDGFDSVDSVFQGLCSTAFGHRTRRYYQTRQVFRSLDRTFARSGSRRPDQAAKWRRLLIRRFLPRFPTVKWRQNEIKLFEAFF